MTTPYMSMSLPVVGVTLGGNPGTAWGPLMTQSLLQVDSHDHSTGHGAPLNVNSSSFIVTSDLVFSNHSISGVSGITATCFTGSLTGSVFYTPTTSSNWFPVPTTTTQALNLLAAANSTSSLAPAQIGVVIASASISQGFSRQKNGLVLLNGMLVVNPSLASSGTAQFFRDSTPIGPLMTLPLNALTLREFNFGWSDTLPDSAAHAYSFQVSASVGTLSVSANQGGIAVRELN